MKAKLLLVYKWIIISITLQLLILIFFEQYDFGKNAGISKIDDFVFEDGVDVDDVDSIKISEKAKNIKFSFDLKYIGYIEEKSIVILDSETGDRINHLKYDNQEITFFSWLTDRNMLIFATKEDKSGYTDVHVNTMDFDNNQERKLSIKGQKKGSEINAVEFSHMTNVVYAKVLSGSIERIFSFDIMSNMEYVTQVPLGTYIKETHYSDNLLIDEQKGAIKVRDGNTNRTNTIQNSKSVLLGVDSNDIVYVGGLDKNNKVNSVKYGEIESGKVPKWDEHKLEQSVKAEDLIITKNGRIFINDIINSKIIEVGNKFSKKYKGLIVEVREDSIITVDNQKIKVTKFN